jgi:hypothetical protein
MENENFKVDPKDFELIAQLIQSDASPVGIDAKKTHILILNKLQELCERMERIEQKLN